MTKFNITNFVKPKKESIKINTDKPVWYENASIKVRESYEKALTKYTDIKQKIISKQELSIRNRKLVLAQIASEVGVDRSYLTERRTPDLCKFVKDCNTNLNKLWEKHRPISNGGEFTKVHFQREMSKYKQLYKDEQDKNYSSAISKILQSELYEKSSSMAQKCAELEEEIRNLNKTVANLRSRLRYFTITEIE